MDIFLCLTKTIKNMCPYREDSKYFDPSSHPRRQFDCPSNDTVDFSVGQLGESISSSESIESSLGIGYRPRWVECRFPIANRTDRSRAMEEFSPYLDVSRRKTFELLCTWSGKIRRLIVYSTRLHVQVYFSHILYLLRSWGSPRRVLQTDRWTPLRISATIHSQRVTEKTHRWWSIRPANVHLHERTEQKEKMKCPTHIDDRTVHRHTLI
jgi:hypothetical protein